ncbi:hypothetical protein RSOL_163400 [Rhizoctonia solani AG-3 Rhs1AP]|uniref:Uncharacterized protein n=2 Tax=Rhizoctonia solani AG-3 TaxID=1086053 RepID=A0A074SL25_9AGAM|nr:hypothetical protein RSOL_163400 [Rhizoctonia solani AG-3 Rhs1AP]KEP50722.1 hypothetical protein V565_074630 [Rhizoctonia solani 123E]
MKNGPKPRLPNASDLHESKLDESMKCFAAPRRAKPSELQNLHAMPYRFSGVKRQSRHFVHHVLQIPSFNQMWPVTAFSPNRSNGDRCKCPWRTVGKTGREKCAIHLPACRNGEG